MGKYSLRMTVWMEFISCWATECMPHPTLTPTVTRCLNINVAHCIIGRMRYKCAFVKGRKETGKTERRNYILTVKQMGIHRCLFFFFSLKKCWHWFPEGCQHHLPFFYGIPVVSSFSEDEEAEDEEAAVMHREVWESSCNLWPLPKHQVSYLVI